MGLVAQPGKLNVCLQMSISGSALWLAYLCIHVIQFQFPSSKYIFEGFGTI